MNKNEIVNAINTTAQGKRSGVSVMTYNETRDFLSVILGCEPDVDTENHEHKRYCRFYPNGKKGTANKVELWERDSKLFSLYVGKNTAFYADNEKAFNNADSVDAKQGKASGREIRLVIPKNAIYSVLGNYIGLYVNGTKKAENSNAKQA